VLFRSPELPDARRDRLVLQYGLSKYDADFLTDSKELADLFEDCLKEPTTDLPRKLAQVFRDIKGSTRFESFSPINGATF
jgi:Asp-tRNA(Asn)/Glu-tRNA(Gln) amidotransferase B subunit